MLFAVVHEGDICERPKTVGPVVVVCVDHTVCLHVLSIAFIFKREHLLNGAVARIY